MPNYLLLTALFVICPTLFYFLLRRYSPEFGQTFAEKFYGVYLTIAIIFVLYGWLTNQMQVVATVGYFMVVPIFHSVWVLLSPSD